jgi:hypothetical protein
MFLATIINIFHICIILFVLIAPFLDIPAISLLHFTFCLSLLTHWYLNNNTCCLTITESYLRGISTQESFLHQFISPMYSYPVSEDNISSISYLVVIVLMSVSFFRFTSSNKFQDFLKNPSKINLISLFTI